MGPKKQLPFFIPAHGQKHQTPRSSRQGSPHLSLPQTEFLPHSAPATPRSLPFCAPHTPSNKSARALLCSGPNKQEHLKGLSISVDASFPTCFLAGSSVFWFQSRLRRAHHRTRTGTQPQPPEEKQHPEEEAKQKQQDTRSRRDEDESRRSLVVFRGRIALL